MALDEESLRSDAHPDTAGKKRCQDASGKFILEANGPFSRPEEQVPRAKVQEAACDTVATFVSTGCGAVTFAATSPRGLGNALSCSALVGSATNWATKAAMEQLIVPPDERTLSWKDGMWGAFNGAACGIGGLAEARVGTALAERFGLTALSRIEPAARLQEAGFRLMADSLPHKLQAEMIRAVTGGAVGSACCSVPRNLERHWSDVKTGHLEQFALDTTLDSIVGGTIGGGIGLAGSALLNRADIAGYTRAGLMSAMRKVYPQWQFEAQPTILRIGHINDSHSALVDAAGGHPFARLASAAKSMEADAAARKITTHFINAGDEFGGTEIDSATSHGLIENRTLDLALNTPIRTLGNHAVDKADDVLPLIGNALQLNSESGNANLVISNIQFQPEKLAQDARAVGGAGVSARDFDNLIAADQAAPFKPYLVKSIVGPRGPEKVGYIALVTEELDKAGVEVNPGLCRKTLTDRQRYLMAAEAAISRFRSDPANQGIEKLILISHLGRSEDIALAREVEGLSAIVGGHSHDAQPTPVWVKTKSGQDVPIVQAGNDMKWLGQLDLAFKPNSGLVDKYQTSGRLLPLTEAVVEDPAILNYLRAEKFYNRVSALQKDTSFGDATTCSDFSPDGIRARQTEFGSVVSDGLLAGVNHHLAQRGSPTRINAFLKQSGDIRKGLPQETRLTGWHWTNVFCNGENSHELTIATMTGEQISRALNFGAKDLPAATPASIWSRLTRPLGEHFKPMTTEQPDLAGNLIQPSGLRYTIDRTRSNRVDNVRIWTPSKSGTGTWKDLDKEGTYKIGALFHTIDKWAKSGIYDDMLTFAQEGMPTKAERIKQVHELFMTEKGELQREYTLADNAKIRGLALSQPRLLAQYLTGETKLESGILTRRIAQDALGKPILTASNLGRLDGRLRDMTPISHTASPYALATGVASSLYGDR